MARRRRGPKPLSLSFVAVNTGMLWITTVIAVAALWPVYKSEQFVLLVGSAILLGSAIAIIGALARWPGIVTFLVTIVSYLIVGVPLAVPTETTSGFIPTAAGFIDLIEGTAFGWKQLVTITIPVGSYQALLVPALVLVLGTTVIGLSIALRARWGELAVLAPVALYITGILFGPTFSTWPFQLSLGLLGGILIWLIWRRWYRRREQIRELAATVARDNNERSSPAAERGFLGGRTILSAALIMALAGFASVGATVLFPPVAPREVVRAAIEQPFNPRDYDSPLSGFRSYEKPDRADATMLTMRGLPKDSRIRIATLDTYDGIVYSVGSSTVASEAGSFTRVPYTFDQSSVRGTPVSITVEVRDYSGVWVPTVGDFESVTFDGSTSSALRDAFYYNNASGTAADVRSLKSGDSYLLTAIEPRQPDESELSELKPGSAEVPRIGVLPDSLSSTLDDWTRASATPGTRLVAMIDALKTNGYVSHGVSATDPLSRSGHSADRITQLLTDQRMIGDQEQYSVTAALMARQLGFPSRVVFGFAPTDVDPAGVTEVKGSDISAWIEVDTAEYGWVTIDPTPAVRPIPDEVPQVPTTIARPQSPVQPPVDVPQQRDSQLPPDSSQDQPNTPNVFLEILFAVLRIAGVVLVVLAILLAPFAVIIAAKIRRRMLRRKAPTPLARISGGWDEFEDSVLDHGFSPPPSPTRTEVAASVGGIQPLVLASVADRAVFSPTLPAPEEADQVWRSVAELRASLNRGLTRRERIRAAISLRSLGGYSVRKLFTK